MKEKNIHAGHRKRMREKFSMIGFKGWSDYEILEYMLYYSYRQGDTNPTAHRLLSSSGNSIVKLLKNAEEIDLTQIVKGVGNETVLYLRSLKAFMEYYRDRQLKEEPVELNGNNVESFIRSIDFPDDREDMVAVCLDRNMRVKCITRVTETSGSTYATTEVDKLIKAAVHTKAVNMILVHNHPSGNDEISAEDINTTIHVEKLLDAFGMFLVDHYILCGNKVVSVKIGRAKKLYGV